MFNAMAYNDSKNFSLTLHQAVMQSKTNTEINRIERNDIDEEELAKKVAKALSIGNDRSKREFNKFKDKDPKHNIIVIDEVDQFNACEKGLTLLVNAILKNKFYTRTNTSIVGIANSVDLPFKKKHSAIAMRDVQLLFEPYSQEDIISILEQKVNSKFECLSP